MVEVYESFDWSEAPEHCALQMGPGGEGRSERTIILRQWSSTTECLVCQTVQCMPVREIIWHVQMSSLTNRLVCPIVQSVQPSDVLKCSVYGIHFIQPSSLCKFPFCPIVQLSILRKYPFCPIVQSVKMSRMSNCPVCANVQYVQLSSLCKCSLCPIVQSSSL